MSKVGIDNNTIAKGLVQELQEYLKAMAAKIDKTNNLLTASKYYREISQYLEDLDVELKRLDNE